MESLEIQRKQEINDLKKELEESGLNGTVHHSSPYDHNSPFNHTNNQFHQLHSINHADNLYGTTFADSKINYIRSMFLQYLCCRDPVVKPHIESALIAIFRYTDEERAVIEEGHKLESQDAITALTTYFGTSLISNFS